MAGKRSRKSAFVPRLVFRTTIAAVIPACAVAACGGKVDQTEADSGSTKTPDGGVADTAFSVGFGFIPDSSFSVAADAYGVADSGFGVAVDAYGPDGVAADAYGVADISFVVAAVAYTGYDGGDADTGFSVAADAYAPADGVADNAYGRGDT
jgi:hypothetical protein